jgi:alpha-glucosidase (family GH31 glycosyl hydrolase)
MRAMWLEFPRDPAVRGLGSQYMWGPNLLVAPVFEKGATQRAVYLPAGTWYDWWTHEAQAGGRTVKRAVDLATLPIYVRAGAIVPVDPVRQYASQPVLGFTTLEVYRGANGTFTLYDDDGISQQYLRNEGSWIRLTWNDAAKTLTVEPGTPAGIGATNVINPKVFTVRMLPEGTERTLKYQGKKLTASF